MRLEEANELLKPGYLPLEAGFARLDDGQLLVAGHTQMPGCRGEMVEWWLGWHHTIEHYKWWHPKDHVWMEWDEHWRPGHFVGATHRVHEFIGGELQKLRIRFRDPGELLDTARFAEAGVTGVACARVGPLEAPFFAGHLIHLCRETPYGCEMRSRFWLGDIDTPDVGATREEKIALFPDELGRALLKHCHEEMCFLAGFLPDLYAKETGRT